MIPIGSRKQYVLCMFSRYQEPMAINARLALTRSWVGKVGSKSNARFQYQHYKPGTAQSTVAGSLISDRILWSYLGIEYIDENTVSDWMKKNLDRDHFFLPENQKESLELLEKYLRARLAPVH